MIFTIGYAYLVMNGSLPWDISYLAATAMIDGIIVIAVLSE